MATQPIRRAMRRVPMMPWIVTTLILLIFSSYGFDSDAVFEAIYEIDRREAWLPLHEGIITYMILSLGWLTLAFYRGGQLKAEIRRRGRAEARAVALARGDALTGLLNRRAFMEEVAAAIERPGSGFIVLVADLDDFKAINDAQGHAAGDAALQSVARHLTSAIGERGVAARLGGDEFAALVPMAAVDATRPGADRRSGGLGTPPPWIHAAARSDASMGAATFPADAGTAEALLHAADTAMYCVKRGGGGGLRFFDPAMEAGRIERRLREEELRRGIPRDEVCPFYQPVVRLTDGAICGFEVLARWRHPRLGLLPPGDFIALAESTGQITALTERLLAQACRDLGPSTQLRFAINVSPTQLAEPLLAERLVAIVRAAGVAPDRVEIELTEDALMSDVERAAAVIATFRASGMTVALDDFGTGFSGLSTLRRLRFDKLKIDRSFVGTMLDSDESRKLVEAILDLGRSFGLTVTAEGIEDAAVLAALAEKGCALGQGYLFGKPMPFDAAADLVELRLRSAA